MRVVVVGGGIGGLAAALGLGRAGHDVVVVDRDPPPPASAGEAFTGWSRRGVRQWQQYHVFRTRARRELAASVPDILRRLADVGAFGLADDERILPSGVPFTGVGVRRPVLEWVLRREVEACSRVEVLASTAVSSVSLDPRLRSATGVGTASGGELGADLVVDAAGRRTPFRGWCSAAGYEPPAELRMSCGIAYYSRYYESVGADSQSPPADGVETVDVGFMAHAVAVGDGGTVGSIFIVPAHRAEFRGLGSVAGWDAAVAQIPRMSEILDPAVRRPLTAPAAMYGLENALAPWRADGAHGPRRLVPVGDSWLVTNPNLAWGSSVALSHAFALAEAFDEHGADVDAAIDHYRTQCATEVEQLYEAACEADRTMHARWRLDGPCERRPDDLEREALMFGLARLVRRGDLDVGRRLSRRAELLELPDDIWADEALMAKARASLDERPYDPTYRPDALDEDRFLAAVGAAAEQEDVTRPRRGP